MPVYKARSRDKNEAGRDKYRIVVWHGGRSVEEAFRGTAKEAAEREARLRLELAATAPGEYRTAPGFSSFCLGAYDRHAEMHHGKGTRRNRKYQIAALIDFFGNKSLNKIRPEDIEEFQHARLRPARTERVEGPDGKVKARKFRAVRAAGVNESCKTLSAILGYAVERKIISSIPDWTPLPERNKAGRVQVWTDDEVALLYAAIQEHAPRLLGVVVTMLNTGMRKGEAIAMEWSWIDIRRQIITVRPNEEWQPKNGRAREIPLGTALLPWLDVPVAQRASRRYVFPKSRKRGGEREPGRFAGWPQLQFDRAVDAAGIGGGPHVCRHTFASAFLQARPDMYLLSQILGHSSIKVTERNYAHLRPGHLESARDAVCLPAPLSLVPAAMVPPRFRSADGAKRGNHGSKRKLISKG